jgi:hypothetical protein
VIKTLGELLKSIMPGPLPRDADLLGLGWRQHGKEPCNSPRRPQCAARGENCCSRWFFPSIQEQLFGSESLDSGVPDVVKVGHLRGKMLLQAEHYQEL